MQPAHTLTVQVSWYDNEWGYSRRVCDLVRLRHSFPPPDLAQLVYAAKKDGEAKL